MTELKNQIILLVLGLISMCILCGLGIYGIWQAEKMTTEGKVLFSILLSFSVIFYLVWSFFGFAAKNLNELWLRCGRAASEPDAERGDDDLAVVGRAEVAEYGAAGGWCEALVKSCPPFGRGTSHTTKATSLTEAHPAWPCRMRATDPPSTGATTQIAQAGS